MRLSSGGGMEAMGAMDAIGFGLLIAGLLLALVLAILWTLMPFAIFGTKDLLRELIREQRRTNEILIAEAKRVRAGDDRRPDDDLRATR
jgi:hypothetical protein